jgi:curli biogenesis system outer membrane secretion channel CsgG
MSGRLSALRPFGYGCLIASVALIAACHQKNETASAPAAAEKMVVAANPTSAAVPEVAAPLRAKPDFGGVIAEHIEVSANGPTLNAAVDNAIQLAIEQVNGKVLAGGSLSTEVSGALAAGGNQVDVRSSEFAQWLASRTSGAVTHFRILSQAQVSKPLSSDKESLKATKGESWDKGSFDASESADLSASGSYQASATAQADNVGRAQASAGAEEKLSASREAKTSGEWDHHDGAQSIDYQKKHTEYTHEWQVKIAADVAKYREAEGAKLTRVVVAVPRAAQQTFQVGDAVIPAAEVASRIRQYLMDALTQTHRFTVLDRDANQEIDQELDLVRSGNASPADTARLGNQLATDLIVIPTIERFEYRRHERTLRLSDRTLVSYSGGGALSFRVVNAVTGQVVMSQSFQYDLPATAPTTLGASADGSALAAMMMDALDSDIVHATLQNTFPPSVIQRQGSNVVINQGGDTLAIGVTYQAVSLGKELVDPQSGQRLGPTESPCCTIQIDRITPTMSYGHILEANVNLPDPFVPGSVELRERVKKAPSDEPKAQQLAKRHPPHAQAERGHDAAGADSNW